MFSQVNALRTIEDIPGTQHINLNTAFQRPMADVFDISGSGAWTYSAVTPTILGTTTLVLADAGSEIKWAEGAMIKPKHSADYWAKVMARFDFSEADNLPTGEFNRMLWKGLMGNMPYPLVRDGAMVKAAKPGAKSTAKTKPAASVKVVSADWIDIAGRTAFGRPANPIHSTRNQHEIIFDSQRGDRHPGDRDVSANRHRQHQVRRHRGIANRHDIRCERPCQR
jgi:hypothetical protein